MLKIVHSLSALNFSELMQVHSESNLENGAEQYFLETPEVQLHNAQIDFYNYLNSVFFRQSNSYYAIWEDQGRYVSALRVEPYSDGLLICALETEPQARRKGYASLLIQAVQSYLKGQGSGVIYSHVSKKNSASLSIHNKCGFEVVKDYAVYSDGSVLHSNVTLAYRY